jgi:TPP-dependent pyruvate/acetoin dehydrogenase alpha subunit
MRRYPAFEPPEYVNWKADPSVLAEYRKTIEKNPAAARLSSRLPRKGLLGLYRGMVRFRLHDIMLKRWVRQGVLSKAWLGTGEEAVTVGNCHALRQGDVVGPMIRNAGACREMGVPLSEMLKAYLGTRDALTRGRDLHTGDLARGVLPPTSFVASLVPVMAGMALAFRLRGEPHVALTWVGDGAARTGEFHEGLSLAAARRVPLVVVLQNNSIALGTRYDVHSRAPLESMAASYGVKGLSCDGNNVLDVLAASREAVEACRSGEGPILLTAHTFRMGGHVTHDEAEGRALCTEEEFARWGARDPIGCFEAWLVKSGRKISVKDLESVEGEVTAEVHAAAETALESRSDAPATPEEILSGVYAEGTLTGATPEEILSGVYAEGTLTGHPGMLAKS